MASDFEVARKVGSMLAGCSSASGPTYSAYSIGLPNNERAFQVNCPGIFESQNTCYSKAREICGNQVVHAIQEISPLASAGGHRDVRTLMFQCVAPPVAQTAPIMAPAAPAPHPAPIRVSPPAPTQQKLSLSSDASFDVDKATLTANARHGFDTLIGAAAGTTFNTVAVKGYTDSTASTSYNQKLSTRRAQSVAKYLKDHGLKARQFVVAGYGEADPVASNENPSGRAKNRRVEILLDNK
jgi:OOP family OmpA-OmpF porin